jgi:hypothetical protein
MVKIPAIFSLFLFLFCKSPSWSQHIGLHELSSTQKLSFTSSEKKNLPGFSIETATSGAVQKEDVIGNFAVVSMYYQNSCYIDGEYNNNNYTVEKGLISNESGSLKLEAFKVYEPTHKATEFLGSQHNVYYRFPTKEDYFVYVIENNDFKKIAEVKAVNVKVAGFTKINNLTVSNLKGSSIFVFAPSKTLVRSAQQSANGMDGYLLSTTAFASVYLASYSVSGSPFDNGTNADKSNRYFFSFQMNENKTGVIWQDISDLSLHLTVIGQDVKKFQTTDLPNPNRGFLAAATGNQKGEAFYVTIFEGTPAPVSMMMSKYSPNSKIHLKTIVNASKSGANIFAYQQSVSSLHFSNNMLVLMLTRTMNKSADGLNHQGGIAMLFDATKMSLVKNYGQTSGHSFDNFITSNAKGEFIGMDLGDNFPRGIHLHKFDNSEMYSKLVYTFKTRHSSTANCYDIKKYPYYPEISSSSNKFYKWSNDNQTYTELGSILEASDGYLVSFLGEPDKLGKSLNCSEAGAQCSRNVGFVKVKLDFYNLDSDLFLSRGITEAGGFFDFQGRWTQQQNMGVVWLTAYKNPKESTAKYLKTVKLKDGNFLFMWEIWANDAYKNTVALKTDQNGKPIGSLVNLGNAVRLDRRNELLVEGNQVLIFSGNAIDNKLNVTFIELK